MRDSKLSGEEYAAELLMGNETRLFESTRMRHENFAKLCRWMREVGGNKCTRNCSIEQTMLLCLSTSSNNTNSRTNAEKWQHSTQTCSKMFWTGVHGLVELYEVNSGFRVEDERDAREFEPKYQAFRGAIGCVDGSHIRTVREKSEECRHRNRKGDLSTNLMLVCSRRLRVEYCLPGWEGSASDIWITIYGYIFTIYMDTTFIQRSIL